MSKKRKKYSCYNDDEKTRISEVSLMRQLTEENHSETTPFDYPLGKMHLGSHLPITMVMKNALG